MKKFLKSYCVGFIISVLLCGSVYAATYFASSDVTYDNTESGLSSTDVQGAIDELYTECTKEPTAGETIIENATLEKDPYECRYFFTGANPNNYVTFNGEKAGWRIISVECDGTIKIIRIKSIGNMAWDTSNSSNWARPASLNTYLNGTYYNGLSSIAQNQIISHNWNIGSSIGWDNDLANQVNDESSITWNGKIALATVSEYIRSNSNKSGCGTGKLIENDYFNDQICKNTTWMITNNNWWTLTPDYSYEAYDVWGDGFFANYYCEYDDAVRPALYLSSNIKITGGNGSQSNPYQISL